MSVEVRIRGAAAVGLLDEVTPLESRVVRYLRLWCESHAGQAEVWKDLVAELGPARAKPALDAFGTYLNAVALHARRPLQRHGLACRCLGADEAVMAMIPALAARGERGEAGMMAALLCRCDGVADVSSAAEGLALALTGVPSSETWAPPPRRALH